MEGWTAIRYLRAQGKSIRAITKELAVSRNTVRAALRKEDPPQYQRPKRPNAKLAPFAEQIAEMFFEKRFIGSRILRELSALGYQGRSTAVYEYLRTLKTMTADRRVTERFETLPAQQAQFDWSPYTVTIGDATIKVIVFCLTLAFSRRKFYWPSLDETQSSIFEAVEAALRYYGGAPKELLVDNARAFVNNADPAHFEWNRHFLELCGHYSIKPIACRPARPRTKGKVERPFFYLEQHFIKGRTWESFDAFARELAAFAAEELDHLIHTTTGERPIDRFNQEQPFLTPLPTRPFIGTHEEMRKVSWDCLASFGGSRYSVPWQYAGKQVWLRPSQGMRLAVRNQKGQAIASHRIASKKGSIVIDPVHYEGLRTGQAKTRVVLEASFRQLFPEYAWFAEGVFIQHKPNGVAHLRAILALADVYPHEALESAFRAAKEFNTYSHTFVRGLLEASGTARQRPSVRDEQTAVIPLRHYGSAVIADLTVYQRVLEAAR